MSLNENVSHGLYLLISIIPSPCGHITTNVRGISRTKTDSRITRVAMVFVISKDTNSDPAAIWAWMYIKPLQVTMLLQRGLGSQESLPLVTTQCGGTIFSVGDQ